MIGITGATGKLGRFVIREFPNAVVIGRRPVEGHPFIRADLSKPLDRHLFKDIDLLIHLAGSTNFKDPEIYRANLEPAKRVRDAYDGNIILASSVSVYGKRVGMATEDTPPRPDSEYARAKFDAEQVMDDAMILRIGTVFGPFGYYSRMIKAVRGGLVVLPSHDKIHVPFISVWDVARAFKAAAKRFSKGVYLVVPEQTPTVGEMLGVIEHYFNRRAMRLSIGPLFKWLFDEESYNVLTHDRIFIRKRDFGWRPSETTAEVLRLLQSI